MTQPVDCVTGPDMSCVGGAQTQNAEFIFDIESAIQRVDLELSQGIDRGNKTSYGDYLVYFWGFGDNQSGYSSQDTGTIVYVNGYRNFSYSPNPACGP